MKTPRSFVAGVVALVVALAVALAVVFAWQGTAKRNPAPDVAYTLLDGRQGTLRALRGKVVLVSFWSMNCDTCVNEMPSIVATDGMFRARGYETLAIAMSYDPPNYVVSFVQTRQLPFPVALDVDGAHARAFGNVQLTPTSFIIGKDGRILEQKLGELDFVKLRALLDRELS